MRFRLGEIVRLTGGILLEGDEDLEVRGASIDSRGIEDGNLFIAFRGEFVDGHRFIGEAMRRGAAASLVTDRSLSSGPAVLVEDPTAALRELARWARDVVDPIVVGITGSTGKTSTKDLVAAIASRKFNTVASIRNYNNEIGVPLTFLSTTPATEIVICEMGARGAGQIAELCEYARPQVGIVTNVGVTHFEQFGSKEAIAEAKADLVRALPDFGTAVLNSDDPVVRAMIAQTQANVLTFGEAKSATVRCERVELDDLGRPGFRMVAGGEAAVWVYLRLSGKHQVSNALAASGAGLALGLSLDECRAGLEAAKGSPWRMEVVRVGGITVVNDAYNSSPSSLQAAFETCTKLSTVPTGGRVIAVLGGMAELGEISAEEHRKAGALAAASVTRLIIVGDAASGIAEGARSSGMQDVTMVSGSDEALTVLKDLRPGDVVIVKGSRAAGLEALAPNIVEGLRE